MGGGDMRVFLTPQVIILAKKDRLPNESFCKVAGEVVSGEIRNGEADLGAGLFKKRIGRNNQGKRDGLRMIVGFRSPKVDRVVFVFGFPKSTASTLTSAGHTALSIVAKSFFEADDQKLDCILRKKEVMEIMCDGEAA
jgi:hypothetical protein